MAAPTIVAMPDSFPSVSPDSQPDRIDHALLTHLQSWQGRSQTLHDVVSAAPVRALSATLDRADPEPEHGSHLPPLWHWLYHLPHARHSEIGADGHPLRGGFLPPVPLPRRMWAGGRLQWEQANPICVGQSMERCSTIGSVTHKSGRSGELLFVQVEHRFSNAQGLALTEAHDIVYRAQARPGDRPAPPQAPPLAGQSEWSRSIRPDDVLLFRYSALTFNGHRIHYDRRYVTEVEGYPGLVVHGPLIATLLLDLVRRECPQARLLGFQFKAVRPIFDLQPFSVHGLPSADGHSVQLWAEDAQGALCMQAQARLA